MSAVPTGNPAVASLLDRIRALGPLRFAILFAAFFFPYFLIAYLVQTFWAPPGFGERRRREPRTRFPCVLFRGEPRTEWRRRERLRSRCHPCGPAAGDRRAGEILRLVLSARHVDVRRAAGVPALSRRVCALGAGAPDCPSPCRRGAMPVTCWQARQFSFSPARCNPC